METKTTIEADPKDVAYGFSVGLDCGRSLQGETEAEGIEIRDLGKIEFKRWLNELLTQAYDKGRNCEK